MTQRCGIDTTILVRPLTGDPEDDFSHCVRKLTALVEEQEAEIFASNQVIGEAYVAVQYHYGVTKGDVRTGLVEMLQSGLVAPLYGSSVFAALAAKGGCGLLDRLITDDYHPAGLVTLTVDRKMVALESAQRI